MAKNEAVRLEVEGPVAEIVFCRPPVNPMSISMLAELNGAIDGIPDTARAVLLRSDVPKVFIAGADIEFMRSASLEEQGEYVLHIQRTFGRFERMPQPVVAAIDGHCLGGGVELALTCDVRVATENSTFGLPEVTLGIIAGAGGIQRLRRALPEALAHDMLLTGRRIDGKEAAAAGMLSRLVGKGKATETGREIAEWLAGGAATAIQATKRLSREEDQVHVEATLAREHETWMAVRSHPDASEGLGAFLEKRSPSFE